MTSALQTFSCQRAGLKIFGYHGRSLRNVLLGTLPPIWHFSNIGKEGLEKEGYLCLGIRNKIK